MHQGDDHGSPKREQHVADRVTHTVAQGWHAAISRFLHGRQCRRRRATASADAEENSRVQPKKVPANQNRDDVRHGTYDKARNEEREPRRADSVHEAGAGADCDCGQEPRQAHGIQEPDRRPGGAAKGRMY